ncbi:MAG: ABC-F family ATP-binding cassette domain-containing protein [Candidatus Fimadaptatus sp.]
MTVLTLTDVSKAFGVNVILEDINLTLQRGQRMGLVGVNGSGKSTLLKVICGEEAPDAGSISIMKGWKVGYLTQQADILTDSTCYQEMERAMEPVMRMEERLRELEQRMASVHDDAEEFERVSRQYDATLQRFEHAGGYEWRSRIRGVLSGLGFTQAQQEQPASLLSGGERTRLCLARMLLVAPDLLLLDEPTNHLDLDATAWLEEALKKYDGTVIVISHDRYFLDEVCDCMAELSGHHLKQYAGNYTEFARKRAADRERQEKEYELQQAEIARQKAIIARYRMYNREKSLRAAASREKALERMELVDRPTQEQTVHFRFTARRRTGDDVLMTEELSKSFDGRRLFEHVNMHIRAGERVALIGPNGVGKSTLLKVVMKQLAPDSGYVRYGANLDLGYYDQHQENLHLDKQVIDEIWDDYPYMEPDQVRGALALFLLTGDEVFQPVRTLSGGERGRLALTKLMLRRDNFLIFDEPTNHLDMDSREVLEQALKDFTGTLLFVSHDRYFINRLATRVLELGTEGIKEYQGNYDDYIEKKRKLALGLEEEQAPGRTRTAVYKEQRKLRMAQSELRQLKARVQDREKQIAAKEDEIAALEERMSDPAIYQDPSGAAQVNQDYERLKRELEALYDEWSELSERLEGADG